MKKTIKKPSNILLSPFIIKDYILFSLKKDKRFTLKLSNLYPQIKDRTVKTNFDRHYIYHTAWAARKVREINPSKHVDISSSLYFSGIVSASVPVDFYDYRPADLSLSNFESKEANLTKLHFADNSIVSLSCMHTVEHIGLGRYGDKIDPTADISAINELKRVLAPNGSLLFVVPIGGKALIEFNAHRIYTYAQITEYFKDLKLVEFSLIRENDGSIISNAKPELSDGEKYACGCFWFKK